MFTVTIGARFRPNSSINGIRKTKSLSFLALAFFSTQEVYHVQANTLGPEHGDSISTSKAILSVELGTGRLFGVLVLVGFSMDFFGDVEHVDLS